uniref:Uncharacterized protein n=1 Tax=Anguilla anguilla TaxID=7936 RepID=A0A0E9RCH0_ANGAN
MRSFPALGTVLPSRVFNTLAPGFGYTLCCTSLWISASAKCLYVMQCNVE